MIEREFVKEKIKHFKITKLINTNIRKFAGIGDVNIERTPLGEKITIYATRPGLIIGAGGETVKELTIKLKKDFGLDNPQIEIKEIDVPEDYASVIAKRISSDLERFGPSKFKALGYRLLGDIMRKGAMGAEIRISGVGLPGARARTARFYDGHIKKSGNIAVTQVDKAYEVANLKKGTVGIRVLIMHKDTILPDQVKIMDPPTVVEEKIQLVKEEPVSVAETKPEPEIKADEPKKIVKKKTPKKATEKATKDKKEAK